MKRLIVFFGVLLPALGFGGDLSQYMQIKKSMADAVAVYNTLQLLKEKPEFKDLKRHSDNLDTLFTQLKNEGTGFVPWAYPLSLTITDQNRMAVYNIVAKIIQIRRFVQQETKKYQVRYGTKYYASYLRLTCENPGDYYSAVDSSGQFALYEHPLLKEVEFLGLQDIGFEEVMTTSDSSLWNMTKYCPKLKMLYLFAAEVTDTVLTRLQLEKFKKMEILELSENNITQLPSTFNTTNSLHYLGLSQNNITALPENSSKWTNLKILNLRGNPLSEEEQERITKALPHTEIIF